MKYRVLVGINYPAAKGSVGTEARAEPGAVVSDLPEASVGWLVEQGIVEAADSAATAWLAKQGIVTPVGAEEAD